MSAFEPPLYVSRRTPASLWQEYRIYPDRLELHSGFAFTPSSFPQTKFWKSKSALPFQRAQRIHLGHQARQFGLVPPRPRHPKNRILQTHRLHAGQSGRICAGRPRHAAGRAHWHELIVRLPAAIFPANFFAGILFTSLNSFPPVVSEERKGRYFMKTIAVKEDESSFPRPSRPLFFTMTSVKRRGPRHHWSGRQPAPTPP